jgi:tetratricopeptide (TPR) repeat protein
MKIKLYDTRVILWVQMLLFLFFWGTSPVLAGNQKPGELTINAEQQYRFAMGYFKQNQYFKAIAEFERFIYFFPDNLKVDDAKYHIGLAYYESGRFREAIDPLSEVAEKSPDQHLRTRALFRLSETFIKLADYQSAITLLDHVAETAKKPVIRDEAHYRAGWVYLKLEQIEIARQRFRMISPQNHHLFRVQELEKELSQEKLYSKKNPRLAGFLSILPGAGFAYSERYQDALVAFLLNTGLILAAYESFDNGNEALGSLIVFVGAGFYAGNIYGAVASAHKYNRDSHQRFLDQLKAQTQVTLSVVPENQGMMLGFQVKF